MKLPLMVGILVTPRNGTGASRMTTDGTVVDVRFTETRKARFWQKVLR